MWRLEPDLHNAVGKGINGVAAGVRQIEPALLIKDHITEACGGRGRICATPTRGKINHHQIAYVGDIKSVGRQGHALGGMKAGEPGVVQYHTMKSHLAQITVAVPFHGRTIAAGDQQNSADWIKEHGLGIGKDRLALPGRLQVETRSLTQARTAAWGAGDQEQQTQQGHK